MFITVFTPTYNRAKYLSRLYNSLLEQKESDFEWVVVDDGSTDGTGELVAHFIAEQKINIVYHRQQNSGKHIAINKGVELSRGKLFFTVDSDDFLTGDSLSVIRRHWEDIEQAEHNASIIGISGHRVYHNGEVIGGSVSYDVWDVDLLEFRFKHKIKGDKAEVYLTEVMRRHPFPKIPGENFCPEALVFYRLANEGFKLRQINQGIYVGEYLAGGLTDSAFKVIRNSPVASAMGYADMVNFRKVGLKTRIKYAILFWRFSFWAKKMPFRERLGLLDNKAFLLLLPVGYLLYLKDKRNIS